MWRPGRRFPLTSYSVTALNPYATLVVALNPVEYPSSYAIQMLNASKGIVSQWQTLQIRDDAGVDVAVQAGVGPYGVNYPYAYFNIPADAGDQLTVIICQVTGAVTSSPVAVALYGLGEAIRPYPLRSDGRIRPQGTNVAGNTSNGPLSGTLIAAPTSPARFLVGNITLSSALASSFFEISGTVNGASQIIAGVGSATAAGEGNVAQTRDEGLLLDAGTAITFNITAGASMMFSIEYDIVI
jgi:hypothetical protein